MKVTVGEATGSRGAPGAQAKGAAAACSKLVALLR